MKCNICPNNCNVNRCEAVGKCGVLDKMLISKYYLHPYEEPVISGTNGSGTIFFSGCALKCVYCQNYELSRAERGMEITPQELADIFKELEDLGAHNINLVTPSHYALPLLKAFEIYAPKIPVVYNTHAYEKVETLKLLNPYISVYLPDMKFVSSAVSSKYTGKADYFEVASKAISYMMSEKKTVIENGLISSGVIVRHLILPQNVSDSKRVIDWFVEAQKNGAYLSLMAQYTPFGDIENFKELQRKITKSEYDKVVDYAFLSGVKNAFIQELSSSGEEFIPSWDY